MRNILDMNYVSKMVSVDFLRANALNLAIHTEYQAFIVCPACDVEIAGRVSAQCQTLSNLIMF